MSLKDGEWDLWWRKYYFDLIVHTSVCIQSLKGGKKTRMLSEETLANSMIHRPALYISISLLTAGRGFVFHSFLPLKSGVRIPQNYIFESKRCCVDLSGKIARENLIDKSSRKPFNVERCYNVNRGPEAQEEAGRRRRQRQRRQQRQRGRQSGGEGERRWRGKYWIWMGPRRAHHRSMYKQIYLQVLMRYTIYGWYGTCGMISKFQEIQWHSWYQTYGIWDSVSSKWRSHIIDCHKKHRNEGIIIIYRYLSN